MNLLSDVIAEIIVFVLGIIFGTALRWVRITIPIRNFWRIDPDKKVIIAVSLAQPDPSEHTINVPTGDTLAFGEIVALIRRLYPQAEVKFHRNPERPLLYEEEWNSTIVLIGGGKSNMTTRCLLAALSPPTSG